MDETNMNSYEKRYETYLLDGQLLFRRNKYQQTKNKYPTLSDIDIYRIIDNKWNNLTPEEQQRWNSNAENQEKKNNYYNPNNFLSYRSKANPIYGMLSKKYSNNQPCPINETKNSYKKKTGLDCYEVCPPGKARNSDNKCVRHCEITHSCLD